MTSPVGHELQQLLADTYRIEREIARGGMATVYLATDLRHDRPVALKVMHPEVSHALGRERFLREIRLAAGLSHPNILALHDSGEAGEFLYYVMPYVDGETLRHRLAKQGPLPVEEAIRLAREAAEAIGYAHSLGIVHRDIKPENILLSRGHAVVADFGIARAIDASRDDRITASGFSVGTPAYMSPEHALGEEVDARADIWAMGCMLYEMLAGTPPFGTSSREVVTRSLTTRPQPLEQLRKDVPAGLERVVDKALARDREDRFSSAPEFAAALDDLHVARNGRTAGRLKSRWPVVAGIAAILVAVPAVMLLRSDTAAGPVPITASNPRLSPDSVARELYRMGRAEYARRTTAGTSRAIALYMQALERDPNFARGWAELARTASWSLTRGLDPGIPRDSLLALAVRASERASQLSPDDPVSWLVKASAARLVDPTDLSPAIFAIRRSLALDSMNADAWFSLGVNLEESYDTAGAIAAWRRAARLDPSDPLTLSFIAHHYFWNGDYAGGVPWADSAVKLDPTYLLGREISGLLAIELGRLDDARRQYDVAMQVTSKQEQANPLSVMARIAVKAGDTARGRQLIARSMALFDTLNPPRHEAAYGAAALAALGDTTAAVRLLSAYAPRGDTHFQLHLKRDPGLGWLKGHRGRELFAPDPARR